MSFQRVSDEAVARHRRLMARPELMPQARDGRDYAKALQRLAQAEGAFDVAGIGTSFNNALRDARRGRPPLGCDARTQVQLSLRH
jgi:hypothetical protein